MTDWDHLDTREVDPVLLAPEERLPGEFQEDALKGRLACSAACGDLALHLRAHSSDSATA